jgi:hypothetical protein
MQRLHLSKEFPDAIRPLCAAIFAALDAGDSLKEIARTLRLLADELDK